jgi:hypothetical protein
VGEGLTNPLTGQCSSPAAAQGQGGRCGRPGLKPRQEGQDRGQKDLGATEGQTAERQREAISSPAHRISPTQAPFESYALYNSNGTIPVAVAPSYSKIAYPRLSASPTIIHQLLNALTPLPLIGSTSFFFVPSSTTSMHPPVLAPPVASPTLAELDGTRGNAMELGLVSGLASSGRF